MKVTNKERMSQLSSSIEALVSAIERNVDCSVGISRVSSTTVGDAILLIKDICKTIGGDGEDAKYYYCDLDIGFTEDTFPVEHK